MVKRNKYILFLTALVLVIGVAQAGLTKITENVIVSNIAENTVTVVLDAGHGGLDSGCVGSSGALEKEINLSIVMKLKDMLEVSGVNVVLTRASDKSIHDKGVTGIRNQKESDMDNRLKIINDSGADALIMVHQNKFTDPQYSGAQMFYNMETDGGEEFADILQKKFVEFLQPDNEREIKEEEEKIYLLSNSSMPGVLCECGFLSNPEEEALLSDNEYQSKVAFTIYCGLMEFLNI